MKSLAFDKKLAYAAVVIVVVLLLIGTIQFYPRQPNQAKAAIIDQLSSYWLSINSRHVNQTFIDTTKTLLSTRFVGVDYYSNNATVENYKSLSSLGYKLIIWRAHTALNNESKYVAISTSERYGSTDFPQYSNGELALCQISGDPVMYFAITPKFIAEVMSGRFEDTVIILMSCNGLKMDYEKTAEAFVEKGAKVFISWDGWVEPTDNDDASALLLHYLISENNTISQAVDRLLSYPAVGGPRLSFYPKNNPEAANYQIPNYKQSIIASTAEVSLVAGLKKNLRARLE